MTISKEGAKKIDTSNKQTYLILFTKQFPYGTKETYVRNELELLCAAFERVIIVPFDAYNESMTLQEISSFSNLDVFFINSYSRPISLLEKLQMNFRCFMILLKEILAARDGREHLKYFTYSFTYSKVCYLQCLKLREYMEKRGLPEEQCVFYNYWLHKGAIITAFYNKIFTPRIKSVSRAHSKDLYHKDWDLISTVEYVPFLPFERFKIANVDLLLSITEHGLKHLNRIFPWWQHKFKLSRLGVHNPSKKNSLSDSNVFRLVSVSAITPNKRIEWIPKIIARINDKRICWTHFGGGDKTSESKLRDEIEKWNVADQCELRGQVSNDEVLKFYAESQVNLLLNLSCAEGLPVSIMEAFSYGIPALVTDTVGNPEIVNQESGIVVKTDLDINQIAERIIELMSDNKRQLQLREGAWQVFQRSFEVQKCTTQLLDYFSKNETLIK